MCMYSLSCLPASQQHREKDEGTKSLATGKSDRNVLESHDVSIV